MWLQLVGTPPHFSKAIMNFFLAKFMKEDQKRIGMHAVTQGLAACTQSNGG
jgi:hypothetical protein